MKITYIEVEASNEDLRACKNLAENFSDILNNAFGRINASYERDDEVNEGQRGEE